MISSCLISIWATVAMAVYSLEFARLHLVIRIHGRQPLNRKPFNCEACLPVWLFAATLPVAIYNSYLVAALASACTAGILSPIIIKMIRK